MAWSLHDAKNRLSQLVRDAQDAPQTISVRGEERAVVLSSEAYRRLTRGSGTDLRAFLTSSPWAEVDLDVAREGNEARDLDLGEAGAETASSDGAQANTT